MDLLTPELKLAKRKIAELEKENKKLASKNTEMRKQIEFFNQSCNCPTKIIHKLIQKCKPGPQGESQKWTFIEEFRLYGLMKFIMTNKKISAGEAAVFIKSTFFPKINEASTLTTRFSRHKHKMKKIITTFIDEYSPEILHGVNDKEIFLTMSLPDLTNDELQALNGIFNSIMKQTT